MATKLQTLSRGFILPRKLTGGTCLSKCVALALDSLSPRLPSSFLLLIGGLEKPRLSEPITDGVVRVYSDFPQPSWLSSVLPLRVTRNVFMHDSDALDAVASALDRDIVPIILVNRNKLPFAQTHDTFGMFATTIPHALIFHSLDGATQNVTLVEPTIFEKSGNDGTEHMSWPNLRRAWGTPWNNSQEQFICIFAERDIARDQVFTEGLAFTLISALKDYINFMLTEQAHHSTNEVKAELQGHQALNSLIHSAQISFEIGTNDVAATMLSELFRYIFHCHIHSLNVIADIISNSEHFPDCPVSQAEFSALTALWYEICLELYIAGNEYNLKALQKAAAMFKANITKERDCLQILFDFIQTLKLSGKSSYASNQSF